MNETVGSLEREELSVSDCLFLYKDPNSLDFYQGHGARNAPRYSLVPDRREFRRHRVPSTVLCEDVCENVFHRQERNVDYLDRPSDFFSADHRFFREEGYAGFADYSVIGAQYSEIGFAQYALAIHIVYFDAEYNLRVAHFVSETNGDLSNPAGKFAEAAGKLAAWNESMQLETVGIEPCWKPAGRGPVLCLVPSASSPSCITLSSCPGFLRHPHTDHPAACSVCRKAAGTHARSSPASSCGMDTGLAQALFAQAPAPAPSLSLPPAS